MEDKGCSPAQTDSPTASPVEPLNLRAPRSYQKFRKTLTETSSLAKLLRFLNERSAKRRDIAGFCRELLDYPGFSTFKTIHLFKHEKGQSQAMKCEVNRGGETRKLFHVNEFNQLFQAIRKSKNRAYGQESLKGFDFDILGTFLAREFALGNHNVILIVSRNDFLPQTEEEKKAFNEVSKAIAPYLNIALEKELRTLHMERAQVAYDNLPYDIQIGESEDTDMPRLPSGRSFRFRLKEELDKADVFHQERIALLGELLNTLKHELSNPLFGLQLSAELLAQDYPDGENSEFVHEISASIKRCQSIISDFTELYTSTEQITPAELEKMVKEVFTLTKSQSRHIRKSYEARPELHSDFIINANSLWLAQILFNLVINSAQALNHARTENPQIVVKAFLRDPFELHVLDNGPGIVSEAADSMFKPFFTTKDDGTGLGLAISQSLAAKLNGSLEHVPSGQGAHFVLKLKS